jgi:hypothetical protein
VSAPRCERPPQVCEITAAPFVLLPLDPVVDPSPCRRARLIPRSAELDYSRIAVEALSGKFAPQACANDVLTPSLVPKNIDQCPKNAAASPHPKPSNFSSPYRDPSSTGKFDALMR